VRLVVLEHRGRLPGQQRTSGRFIGSLRYDQREKRPRSGHRPGQRAGQTLYMLTSEKGGKISCTQANGCTQAWPETLVTNGATTAKAGSGVQASLLGTVKDTSGNLEVTYNHWPLYTFSGDSGPGVAKGQGLTSFGGTWYVLNGSGNPVTSSQSGNASSGGGYGY
jgi:predicted lipoprotein with Yx(FWY)xxD motif